MMVMVSIDFASLNKVKRAIYGPQAFPTRPPGSNILGHGSKLMAISLLALWLVPWPKPWLEYLGPWPKTQAM